MADTLSELVALAVASGGVDRATPGVTQQGLPGVEGAGGVVPSAATPTLDFRSAPSFREGGIVEDRRLPSYAAGGVVTPAGAPPTAGLTPPGVQQDLSGPALEQVLQRVFAEHPQVIAGMKQALEQALQGGNVTPQQLQLGEQLATAAAQNPQLYPQLRQYAIQNGLADEDELPPEYDQGVVVAILLAARAVQSDLGAAGGGAPPTAAPQVPQQVAQAPGAAPSFRSGGLIPDQTPTVGDSNPQPIIAHTGEFVMSDAAVKWHGLKNMEKINAEISDKAKNTA